MASFNKEERINKKEKITTGRITLLMCFLSFIFTFYFFSCRSTPKQYEAFLQETHIPLDTGASYYILADAKKARPVINLLPFDELKDRQTVQLLDRTDYFAAALFPRESNRHFQLAAYGKYPSSRAGLVFSASSLWENRPAVSGSSYWYSKDSGLSIAMTAREAFVVSSINKQPIEPQAKLPGAKIPEGFFEYSRNAPLSIWMNNPGQTFINILSNMGIPLRFPVQQVFMNIYALPAGECEASIRMIFANATQARGAVTVINLASGFLFGSGGFTEQNGSIVDIKTARLSENEFKILLELFF